MRTFGAVVVAALLIGAGGASTGLARAAGPTATPIDLGTLGGDSGISGYSMVQAESRDAAARLFEDHPHLEMPGDSSIELLEFLPLPGS